ncbi:MAG: hypothetical protein HY072_07595, partial [Deltaproteobacteria bacterium]|nr:hypothetical protein [Deltaproteobacteria bacterium]
MLTSRRWLVLLAAIFLGSGIGLWKIDYFKKNKGVRRLHTITERYFAIFDSPHPYRLNHVNKYRFVHQVGEFLIR